MFQFRCKPKISSRKLFPSDSSKIRPKISARKKPVTPKDPKTKTMQTADSFFLMLDSHLFGSSYKMCSIYPTVCYLSTGCTNSPSDCWFNRRPRLIDFVWEIPFSPKYNRIKHRNKLHLPQHRVFFYVFHTFWAQIASIFNVFVVCIFISFVQFVGVAVFWMLLKLVTGNGERGTGNGERGTGVWKRVYSRGNPPEYSTWRTKERRREQIGEMRRGVTVVNVSIYPRSCAQCVPVRAESDWYSRM